MREIKTSSSTYKIFFILSSLCLATYNLPRLCQVSVWEESPNSEGLSQKSVLLPCGAMRLIILFVAALGMLPVTAAERLFNFSDFTVDNAPTNFTSLVAGRGK